MATKKQVFVQETLSIPDLYKKSIFENFTNFSGRATRREFWIIAGVNMLVYMVFMMLIGSLSFLGEFGGFLSFFIGLAGLALSVIVTIANLALTFRRLHDTNRSAWWLLIALIPFGGFYLLYCYLQPGDAGENDYGPPAEYVG